MDMSSAGRRQKEDLCRFLYLGSTLVRFLYLVLSSSALVGHGTR